MLIGEGYYSLEALANLIDNPASVNLIGSTYEVHGKLEVNIIPVNPDGTEDLEFVPDEPSELHDQRIDFIVKIDKALELPEDLCRDVYVEYQWYLDHDKHKTKICDGKDRNPVIDYSHQHTVEIVTKMLVDYMEKEVMVFRVYGFADVKPKAAKTNVKKPVKKPIQPMNQSSTFLGDQSTEVSLD